MGRPDPTVGAGRVWAVLNNPRPDPTYAQVYRRLCVLCLQLAAHMHGCMRAKESELMRGRHA